MPRVVSIRIDSEDGVLYPLECKVTRNMGIDGDRVRDIDRAIAIVDDTFIVNKTTTTSGFCSLRFKENLVIENLDITKLDANLTLSIGSCKLQISAIEKKCHSNCPEYREDGSCLMYKHVAFARVIEGGVISMYDEVTDV